MSRWLNAAALSLLLALGGCARNQVAPPPPPTTAATAGPPSKAEGFVPAPRRPVLPFLPVSSPAPTTAIAASPAAASLSERTAAEIRGRYAYNIVSSDVLVVKRTDIQAPAAALFEQAIALNRLRTTLIARNGIPAEVTHNVRLKDGQATIPFGRRIAPEKAAEAIITALSVEGVQHVRAVF